MGGERWEGGRGILVLKPSSDMPNGRCQSSFHVDIDDVMFVICLAQNVETEKLGQLYEEMLLSRLDYTPLCATAEQSVVGRGGRKGEERGGGRKGEERRGGRKDSRMVEKGEGELGISYSSKV